MGSEIFDGGKWKQLILFLFSIHTLLLV